MELEVADVFTTKDNKFTEVLLTTTDREEFRELWERVRVRKGWSIYNCLLSKELYARLILIPEIQAMLLKGFLLDPDKTSLTGRTSNNNGIPNYISITLSNPNSNQGYIFIEEKNINKPNKIRP